VVTYGPMRINAADPDDPESPVNSLRTATNGDGRNMKISGISLVQVPSCAEQSSAYTDPYGNGVTAPTELPPPDIRLIAHADDDDDEASDTVDKRNNSDISSIEVSIEPPDRLTRILSWAASAD